MTGNLYSLSEVEARTAKPQTLGVIIRDILLANNEACYVEVEPFLRGAANTGSTQFDHAYAVSKLLEHDQLHGGRLHILMVEKNLTHREIWDRLARFLDKSGYKFANGKLVGLWLEDQRETAETDAA